MLALKSGDMGVVDVDIPCRSKSRSKDVSASNKTLLYRQFSGDLAGLSAAWPCMRCICNIVASF